MRFNQLFNTRLAALAVCILLHTACHSHPPESANAPSTTPPNNATAPSEAANSNTAAAGTNSNTQTPAATDPQAAATADCGTCWVHVFDDKNFKATDDNHKICGPGAWPNLRNLPGAVKFNWGDEIESLRVGPGATVKVWTGEQFTGASHTFPPGTEVFSLKSIPGFSDQISSLEIKCK